MAIVMTIILFGILLLAGVYLAGFLLPDHVAMQRAIVIQAPRERIFRLVSDFTEWPHWSPWAARDPQAKYTIEGTGVGHMMSWTSDVKGVGKGSQRIVAYDPPRCMESDLNFGNMGSARAIFTLNEEAPGRTTVTWSFETSMRRGVPLLMQPIATYMGFMMEKFLAPDYEQGLAALKQAAEAGKGSDRATGSSAGGAQVLNIRGADRQG